MKEMKPVLPWEVSRQGRPHLEQPLHCAKRSCGLKSPELLSYLVFVQVIVKMYSYLFSVFHDYTIKV